MKQDFLHGAVRIEGGASRVDRANREADSKAADQNRHESLTSWRPLPFAVRQSAIAASLPMTLLQTMVRALRTGSVDLSRHNGAARLVLGMMISPMPGANRMTGLDIVGNLRQVGGEGLSSP